MHAAHDDFYDLVIVGAGPIGLTLANLLGPSGLKVLVLEKLDALIDYPRGVGMDDECLRVFQAVGLAEKVVSHTTPHQWLDFRTASGKSFALVRPQTDVFGWPKRNGFIQPLVDRVLFEGLSRYANVNIEFGVEVLGFSEESDGVVVKVEDSSRGQRNVRCKYLVGCDGGRSIVRKTAGIEFGGQTESTRWLVVDLERDPIGVPNAVLVCDPARPFVSIALPHGIRRLEFMVKKGETEEEVTSQAGLHRLLSRVIPSPASAHLIRSRVYTHHARIADDFRKGRVLLAGDAAHLMPVWQGQGYNSGIRDANNLAWKLALVLSGKCDDRLLDTYTLERRAHAKAMINLSTTVGRIFSPTSRILAKLRDVIFSMLNWLPPVRDYVVQMRFKPMPKYEEGVVVPSARSRGASPVGKLFIQPKVRNGDQGIQKLDDVVGNGFAIVAWATNPWDYLTDDAKRAWERIGGKILVARPDTEFEFSTSRVGDNATLVGDMTHQLKDWFSITDVAAVVLRPDRFVAIACGPQELSGAIEALAAKLHIAQKAGD
ncbi:bifunctional 3-(3-hydroxy-phenyl)propionate/3-hydroxycinnamic acid hydroxylase [Aminobacter aminovorans]|uniref:3-(3-hydroxy-phenyl)propionate hydroxylase n=1 Tax=Aminobacter aminovorans TaxID=83263 RepID=A0AAC8YWN0_AMIAI|nr:bifunctional 3-(3-hydroxy-phenyl)propionate/3-hydroxycinnamic acid hydroxylase [Aminobacter aminovorans]AMS45514.1 3-(3-hydroxyphenyl)propionate hydroxylase [Aminobacter aminovorans]MBB3708589.1 3-(3-hydroxy-phenyl)propionate hydroxylase [Aminobacter aminovorans]